MKRIFKWKTLHKWIGLVFTIFILGFCVSGIILNHRELFVGCNVDRRWLPSEYAISNYNNGSVRGTLALDNKRVLVFGNAGIWLTDRELSSFSDFNRGLPGGVDERNIKNVVFASDSSLWCVSQFALYRYSGGKWCPVGLPGNKERISDLTVDKGGGGLIVLTRSALHRISLEKSGFFVSRPIFLEQPDNDISGISLFKTIWHLHSGDLFGLAGKLVVDVVAIALILLCITGIIIFILPYRIRRNAEKQLHKSVARKARIMKNNLNWHAGIGFYTLCLTLLITITGMCLRPPLMIPFVLAKTSPVSETSMSGKNIWQDRLRGIRQDRTDGSWLISTSEGFYRIDRDFRGTPRHIAAAPPVSPMGITVFEEMPGKRWLIGSFSGAYIWDPAAGSVTDYFSGKPYVVRKGMRPVSEFMVSGYSSDFDKAKPLLFDYSKGAERLRDNDILRRQPISLWNVALEMHTGRLYGALIGPLSGMYIFLSGTLMILILISGLVRHKRKKSKININKIKQS